MNLENITASHKDPGRSTVGCTAFSAAICRAFASKSRRPLVYDPVACALFDFRTRPKEVPIVFCIMYIMWIVLPLRWVLLLIGNLLGRDIQAATDMLGTRSKFIDDHIIEGIQEGGINQIVIFGSGLDARAARMPLLHTTTAVRVYEVDFPNMLHAKQRLFAEIGFSGCYEATDDKHGRAVFVGTDLSEPSKRWQSDLSDAGFDAGVPTIWVLEGLTGYLNESELGVLFKAVSSMSCKGSLVVATWNGASGETSKTPWRQSIHCSYVDDPEMFLPGSIWKKKKHIGIGAATRAYGLSSSGINATDKSYWLSLHSKL
mmetsp:Transcript_8642/g.12901  ORF Transcript_8642/g.12901 Transcript_8642/m.12901 type:complete len:316 (+) Transcript_8642:47-994(+)